MKKCLAKFELNNGEFVTPCHLEKGHTGDHQGFVLGSPTRWPKGYASEKELYYETPSRPEEVESDNPPLKEHTI